MKDTWIVNPNRFEQAAQPRPTVLDRRAPAPRRRTVSRPDMTAPCIIVLPLPDRYRHARTHDGDIVYTASDWQTLAGNALLLARSVDPDVPRFGIKLPNEAQHHWWDGTRTDDHLLDRPDAGESLKVWLQKIFPDATSPIQAIDNR